MSAVLPEVMDALEASWRRSDRIFELIQPDGWHRRPLPLRHPPVFYLGHLPAFGWNQVGRFLFDKGTLHQRFDDLFERGIDPLSAEAAEAATIAQWPAHADIEAYRDAAREQLRALAPQTIDGADPLARDGQILHVVLEHELMHHETLLYLLQEEPVEKLSRPRGWPALELGEAQAQPVSVQVPGGRVRLGVNAGEQPFAWCNEQPAQTTEVAPFRLDQVPVDNAHFAAFIAAGGYRTRALWSDAAWAWLSGREHPHNWRVRGGRFEVRSLLSWHALASVSGWPVMVSNVEARAYARWAGGRLPTEAELQHAAYGTPDGGERSFPWGEALPTPERANLDFTTGGPVPVGSRPAGASAFGIQELVGNGWEWTQTPFRPLLGFTPTIHTYAGYSADFFDDAHDVVFGASWATDARLARRSFRNWYQRRYPYVYSCFRVARD